MKHIGYFLLIALVIFSIPMALMLFAMNEDIAVEESYELLDFWYNGINRGNTNEICLISSLIFTVILAIYNLQRMVIQEIELEDGQLILKRKSRLGKFSDQIIPLSDLRLLITHRNNYIKKITFQENQTKRGSVKVDHILWNNNSSKKFSKLVKSLKGIPKMYTDLDTTEKITF